MDPIQNDKRARSSFIIGKVGWKRGQRGKFLGIPGKIPGNREKKRRERGLGRALLILSLCTLGRVGRESGRSPAPMWNDSVSGLLLFMCVV